MKHTFSAGGVIVNPERRVLLIYEDGEFWGFPKGHQEPGESLLQTAKREIVEETGLQQITFLGELGTYERRPYSSIDENASELKHITLYLFMTQAGYSKLSNIENNKLSWVEFDQVAGLLTHPLDRDFFTSKIPEIHTLLDS